MAKKKKSLGDKLQKKIHDAADAVKDAVDDVDLPDVKVPKNVQKAAKAIDKGVKKTAHSAAENIQEAAGAVKAKAEEVDLPEKVKDIFDKDEDDSMLVPEEIDGAKVLSTESALKLIYYLMAVNGEIFHAEEEKFDLIGRELDPNFEEDREKIVRSCQAQMARAKEQNDYYTSIQKCVRAAIIISSPKQDSFITPKLLIWDLLAVAYSDDHYDDSEKKLIRYIVKRLNVNEAEFLEMESSFLTLMDIQKEIEWIKTTDRPYKTIETVVNELADRKTVILESVNDLITL